MVKYLFFDLGSTLIDESRCDAYRLQHLLDQKQTLKRGEVLRMMEEFSSKNQNPYVETAKYFGLQTTTWPSDMEKLYSESFFVLNQLRKHYKIGIIANQNPGIKDRLQKFGILELFDVIISSGELGISKPDRRIFEHALLCAGILPGEAVMTVSYTHLTLPTMAVV